MTITVKEARPAVQPRYAGVLLHPTSLPSPYGIGDLGKGAYDFIDFLDRSGQMLWQCLPIGPTGFGDSPYQAFSAFAGQPLLISPDKLVETGLLTQEDVADVPEFKTTSVDYGPVITYKTGLLHKAYDNYCAAPDRKLKREFTGFCRENKAWLEDYALFMALKDYHQGRCWHDWDEKYQFLDSRERAAITRELSVEIGYYEFIQFLFFRQWFEVKSYANSRHISIVGDIPIFVSPDSADVWANKSLFKLDTKGYPTVVAGVPPDYFSATGQLWGNPLYNWTAHRKTGYEWWISRVANQLKLFDFLRIDHFRGFEAYWEVPAKDTTAMNGKWVKGPGAPLFKAIKKALGEDLPIFAEDLGIITPEVEKLRDSLGFPGMKILQFGFDSDVESAYMPYLYTNENCICYTGTHDNDTTLGWYFSTTEAKRDRIRRYMNTDGNNIHWDFIRTALSSTARYAIYPLQDLFGFGNDCRMNTPGKSSGNWTWRFEQRMLTPQLEKTLLAYSELYGRDKERMFPSPETIARRKADAKAKAEAEARKIAAAVAELEAEIATKVKA